jgi:hypothetical protein
MCGIENLRIWHEENTAGMLAMLHYSALFRTGYLTFYLNNALQPVRVRDEGGKLIKIKGLRIPVAEKERKVLGSKERRAGGHDGKKMITTVRIEFSSEAEKNAFMEQTKGAQIKMVDIEDGWQTG